MSKRKAWLEEYFKCWNATEAARRVGYKWPEKNGPRNKLKLQAEIDARLDEMAMSANEVLARLGDIARADLGDFLTDGGLLDLSKIKEDGKTHLIKKYKITQNALGQLKYEIELHDAQSALQHLDRYHGGAESGPIENKLVIEVVGGYRNQDPD